MKQALIIDDNELNLELMTELLQLEGFECVQIQDSMEVSSIIDNLHEISIVFVDIKMPKLDGFQILSILSRHIDPDTPIVACSAYVTQMDVAKETGFKHFISKPLDVKRFPKQIERIMNGETVWES